MMSRIVLCAAVLVGLCTSALPAEAAPLIGYVNMRKALFQVEQGVAAQKKLEAALKKKQKELETTQSRMETIGRKLQDPKTSAVDRAKLNKEGLEIQQRMLKERAELQKLEQEMFSPIVKRMRQLINTMGKKGGYQVILEISDNGLLYGQEKLDLTNEVVRKYDEKFPRKRKK